MAPVRRRIACCWITAISRCTACTLLLSCRACTAPGTQVPRFYQAGGAASPASSQSRISQQGSPLLQKGKQSHGPSSSNKKDKHTQQPPAASRSPLTHTRYRSTGKPYKPILYTHTTGPSLSLLCCRLGNEGRQYTALACKVLNLVGCHAAAADHALQARTLLAEVVVTLQAAGSSLVGGVMMSNTARQGLLLRSTNRGCDAGWSPT